MVKRRFLLFLALAVAGAVLIPAWSDARPKRPQPALTRQAIWQALQKRIERDYDSFKGSAGIVVKDLNTGWETQLNKDSRFAAASLIKIPIMGACFKAAQEGRISLDCTLQLEAGSKAPGSGVLKCKPSGSAYTVRQLIELMITESDNTAANMLIDLVSMEYLNDFFREQGLKGTSLTRKMMDFSGRKKGVENYTSAADIASMLERMYRGSFLNASVSEQCMQMLLHQKMKDRIPRKLPRETPVAHKTGLERRVCHDAGIVFTPQGDFLVCVLTKSTVGPAKVKDFISRLALEIYNSYKMLEPKGG
jgi:beta-lactamase class A